jgi:hypothetical protein
MKLEKERWKAIVEILLACAVSADSEVGLMGSDFVGVGGPT